AEPRVLADFRLEPGPTGPRYVNLAAARPDRPLTPHDVYPGWVPRAPVGLLTAQAGIAVRNVVLTPLP
ncbi:MAG: hypothetical protein K2P78_14435, partial [Gemmataceae bacterium]|nr:hypothetical protein [Gemmataceae bacterium]